MDDNPQYSYRNLSFNIISHLVGGFPDGSSSKEYACNAGDTEDKGSILGSGKSPRGGNCNPLQHSYLEIHMDRGAWQATVHGVAELEMTKLTNHLMYQVLKTHCDEWNDGNHGGSQAAELTCQRVGRLQSLSNDAWARTDSAPALSFQSGPDSRRLALGPASRHSIGHCAGLVRCHLPPCSITCCITALLSQAMLQPAVPTKDPRHNCKLPAGSRHPHPSQATWACVSVYQTKLFLKSYSSHSSLCFTQPFCLNFLEVEILIKSVFEVLIEISKLFLPNHQ